LTFDPEYDLIAILDTSIITYNLNQAEITPFSISPNPVTNSVTIVNNGSFVKSIEIYDLMGRKNKEIIVNGDFRTKVIDLSDLRKGPYILKFATPDNSFMQKIVKL
jgi:hypothetical protein